VNHKRLLWWELRGHLGSGTHWADVGMYIVWGSRG
jgi:hypothetical protein